MKKFKAFTLVELLVVVVIITLLAVIITAAVAGAMRSAKQARIAIELNQIAIALEQYKNVFGEYPPDMFDDTALVRHVKKRWPRFELSGDTTLDQAVYIRTAINTVYSNMGYADVDVSVKKNCFLASLTVWLGGFPAKDSGRFSGFDADPEAPFGQSGEIRTYDKKTFLELEVGKNVHFPSDNTGQKFPCIVSRLNSDKVVPIIYFRGKSGGGQSAYFGDKASTTNDSLDSYNFYSFGNNAAWSSVWRDLGTAAAYADKGSLVSGHTGSGGEWEKGQLTGGKWFEAETYQLIHPGLDGKFGKKFEDSNVPIVGDMYFRSLENLSQEDFDNITNFSDFKTIKSIMP